LNSPPPVTAGDALDAHLAHQPLHRAAGHVVALAAQPQPHLAGTQAGHEPIRVPLVGDQLSELLIPQRPSRRPTRHNVVKRRRGDRAAVLGQHPADRLDPELVAVFSDVVD
jgi:hypothetical protein